VSACALLTGWVPFQENLAGQESACREEFVYPMSMLCCIYIRGKGMLGFRLEVMVLSKRVYFGRK
jgi:hypothetical protein